MIIHESYDSGKRRAAWTDHESRATIAILISGCFTISPLLAGRQVVTNGKGSRAKRYLRGDGD